MSEMSSFYGGRQGASFVIVKRFDGIDIPQPGDREGITEYTYTASLYAVDNNNDFIITTKENGGNILIDEDEQLYLITKDSYNFNDYSWAKHDNNGEIINDSNYYFPIKVAEGMVQCFSKGAKSSSEVNYGEYVIIDTIVNMSSQNNPDNGKVFRRGMDINTDLAGAEYIGQIVGPQGAATELDMGNYTEVAAIPSANKKSYSEGNEDLVPGSYIENNVRKYNDEVKFAWVTMKDDFGNIEGCYIGFQLPTLVYDFEASKVDAHYSDRLIVEDPTQYIDNKWQHPFYQKWQLKIPQGYHGVNSTNLEIIHTHTMPAGFKDAQYEGTKVWSDEGLTVPYIVGGKQLVFNTSQELLRDEYYDINTNYAIVKYNSQNVYVNKNDCYMDILRYRETNFDNTDIGEVTYYELDEYNIIDRIDIEDDGSLSVYFTGKQEPQVFDNVLKWIDDISLSSDGSFSINYNDGSSYSTLLSWIDLVDIEEDGTVNFYYNNDHSTPAMSFEKEIKVIEDIEIAVGETEGSGDQKLYVTYNTDNESVPIGNPLNYIIETAISIPTTQYPNVPYNHLLVYYSDPALREQYEDKWVTYPSSKYSETVWTEWVDLGSVKGEAGGVHIIKNVNDMNELKSGGQWLKPEEIKADCAGWSCTYSHDNIIEILAYDYENPQWYSIGTIDSSSVQPSTVIVKSQKGNNDEPVPADVNLLQTNGIWLAIEEAIYAY